MPDKQLTQTMWGYQHHFRISLDGAADRALDQIGAILSPDAFLVGFVREGAGRTLCLEAKETQTLGFTEDDLAGVETDAKRRYEDSPVHDLEFASEEMREARHGFFRDTARARAVEVAMEHAARGGPDLLRGPVGAGRRVRRTPGRLGRHREPRRVATAGDNRRGRRPDHGVARARDHQ